MNTTTLFRCIAFAAFAGCATLRVNAQAIYAWRGLSDTNWQNSANWSNSSIAPTGTVTFGRINVTNHPTTGFPMSYIADYGTTVFTNGATLRALVMANGSGQYSSMIIAGGTWESRAGAADVVANAGGTGVVTITGGNYVFTNFGAKRIVAPLGGATATLNVNGGNFSVDTLNLGDAVGSTGNGTVNLNGGVLAVKVLSDLGSPVNSTNNFNGGTLLALASTPAFVLVDTLNVQAGGLKLDSQAFNVGIGKPLFNGVGGTDGGLYKSGSGSLFLAVSNSYNGGTTLSNGTIIFVTNGLSTAGTITFAGTSGLKWTNNNEDLSARFSAIPSGATVTFDDGGNNITFNTGLGGAGGIAKAGSGTMTLNVANTFAGNATVSAGALRVNNNGAFGTTAGSSTVSAGRIELANGVTVSGETLTIAGDGGNNVGGLQSMAGGTAVWNGPVFPTGVNTRLGAQTNGTLEIAGQITGNTSLIIRNGSSSVSASDYGTTVFSAANNYTADLQLAGGTLRLAGGNDRLTAGYRVIMGSNALNATLDLNGTSPDIAGVHVATTTSVGVQTIGSSSTTADSILMVGSGGGANTTNTFSGVIRDTLGLGTRKVGVTVAGGQMTLSGTNTYSGPTLVSAGRLIVTPNYLGGGTLTVNDNATFVLNLPATSGTYTSSDLTFSGSNPKALEISLISGNPAGPVLRATNLVLGGTVSLNLSGFGLSVGSIQLIDYDSISGTGDFVTNSLPSGVSAHIETNLLTSSIDLVIDSVPSLVWLGQTNGVPAEGWDIGQTTNWFDRALSQPGVFLNGLNVVFDDSVTNNNGTNWVTLATNVQPFVLAVSNNAVDYTFGNSGGTNTIRGSARLIKDGAATLTLAVSNNAFAGYTHVKSGALKLAALAALPAAPLTNEALLDLNGFSASPGALSGGGVITNSTGSSTTNTLSVGNGGSSGDFSGRIDDGPSGKVALLKTGAGTQVLRNNASTYSGGTTITNATLQLGADNALGSGPVTLASSTLASDGATPRTVTNAVSIAVSSGFGVTGGGAIKLAGPLDFAAGNRNLTNNVPLTITGPSVVSLGGVAAKLGPETLVIQSNLVNWISPIEVQAGTMIVDGVTWTNGGSIRTVAVNNNGITRLVLTNNSLVVVTNAVGVLRAGNANNSTGTNIFDIAATLMFPTPGVASTDGKVLLGNTCNRGTVNLLAGGLLVVRAIQRDTTGSGNHDAEFNFDGGTLKPSASDAAAAFMQGLTEARIRAGGAVIDTTNINVTVGQAFTEDPASTGGGLTKQGTGALLLNGVNTFAGPTLVTAGTLGGTGVISGPVTIQAGAFLAPGTANIGTFVVSNTLSLGGTARIEVNRAAAQTSDQVTGLTTLTMGGALEVSNLGAALAAGDSFDVFSATAYSGQFASVTPASPNGAPALAWDTNQLATLGRLVVHRVPLVNNHTAGCINGATMVMDISKLLRNDTDADGDTLSIVSVTSPTNGGTASLTGTNTLVYTGPVTGSNDFFTYVVSDGRGGTAVATVSMSLFPETSNFNRVSIETLGNGDVRLTYQGIPGYTYALDWTHYLTNPIPWIPILTNTAGGTGTLIFTNTPSGSDDFYRTRDLP